MASKNSPKKLEVPDVASLLGTISEAQGTLDETPQQEVQPVKRVSVNTPQRKNVNTAKEQEKGTIGKPTLKQPGVTYARLSPRIPVSVKKQLDIALIHGGYNDENGQPIRYIDEFVAEAVRRMLANRPDSK
jgi:hypothetical protein